MIFGISRDLKKNQIIENFTRIPLARESKLRVSLNTNSCNTLSSVSHTLDSSFSGKAHEHLDATLLNDHAAIFGSMAHRKH